MSTIPTVVSDKQEPKFTESEDYELKQDLQFLGDQEYLGICTEEIHEDDKKAWDHFIETTNRQGEEFFVRMPFNNKINMLKTNKIKSAARGEQRMMIKSP